MASSIRPRYRRDLPGHRLDHGRLGAILVGVLIDGQNLDVVQQNISEKIGTAALGAAFASPDNYEFLEVEDFLYAIRLPTNVILQEQIAHFLTRPVGRPPNYGRVFHASFNYQAATWSKPRRVVAKAQWHPGELYLDLEFRPPRLQMSNHVKNGLHMHCGARIEPKEQSEAASITGIGPPTTAAKFGSSLSDVDGKSLVSSDVPDQRIDEARGIILGSNLVWF